MRSIEDVRRVAALIHAGVNNSEIARLTGVPRSTIRDWKRARRWKGLAHDMVASCPQCGAPAHDGSDLPTSYAYLLGLYLGDGCLSPGRRGVFRLRISLDRRYPGIIAECCRAIEDLLPANRVHVQPKRAEECSDVGVYSKQLPCLFPQHGAGPKHGRSIVLETWQEDSVADSPGLFLRGLVHSDGSRFKNRVSHGKRVYEYPRYNFSNRSADIRGLFCRACDQLGIEWRTMNAFNISVARRESVAILDAHVGPKR